MRTRGKEIIYWIDIDDIQEASKEILGRRLSPKQVGFVAKGMSKYIDWVQAVEHAIDDSIVAESQN